MSIFFMAIHHRLIVYADLAKIGLFLVIFNTLIVWKQCGVDLSMQGIQGASRSTRLENQHVEKRRDTLDKTLSLSLRTLTCP